MLVNGRRHVSAIQGSSDVDVGSIPIALIERIEKELQRHTNVLPDAALSEYRRALSIYKKALHGPA